MISLHAELFAEQVTQLFIANDSRRPLLAKPYKEQPVRKCAAAAGRQRWTAAQEQHALDKQRACVENLLETAHFPARVDQPIAG